MNYQWRAEITASQLDFLLVSSYGKRNPSPVVDQVAEKYDLEMDEEFSGEALQYLADLMLMMYKPKWDKLAAVYDVEYDPIHNYLDEWEDQKSTETEGESSETLNRNDTLSNQSTTNSTRTDNLKEETERDLTRNDLRTDNLSEEEITDGSVSTTRTDDLTQGTTYNVSDQRTDNLQQLETRDLDSNTTRTDNLTATTNYGSTGTRTDNLQQTDSGASGSREHQIYAFNSVSYQNADKDIFSGENSNTRNNTGTQTDAKSGSDSLLNTGTQRSDSEDNGTITTANTGTQTNLKTGTETVANSGTQSTDEDEDVTVTKSNTGTQSNSRTDDESATVTNTGTVTNAIANASTGTNSRVSNGSASETGSENTERSGRHFGNIGNLTSQKQLKEEIELWKWNYVKEILEDAKSFLSLEVYLNY